MVTGHVEKRGKRGWSSLLIDYGYGPDGKRRRRRVAVKRPDGKPVTKGQAETELRKTLAEIDAGTYVEPSALRYGQWLEDWLTLTRREPGTRRAYGSLIRCHVLPALGDIALQELKPLDIQRLSAALEAKGLAPATQHTIRAIIVGSLGQAERLEMISRNPTRKVTWPSAPRLEVVALDRAQTRTLLDRARAWEHYSALALALWSGLRIGELLGLRWADVDLEGRLLHVRHQLKRARPEPAWKPPKTVAGLRDVPFGATATALLRGQRKRQVQSRLALGPAYHPHDLVISCADGRALPDYALREAFAGLMATEGRAGFPWHGLRHTYATLLLAEGVELHVVSRLLGHSNPSITLRYYAAYLPSSRAAAAERLERAIGGHQAGTGGGSDGGGSDS